MNDLDGETQNKVNYGSIGSVIKMIGIKNPLSIIAIFAALAEVSGTIVLPLLKEPVQVIFVWFVMLFPALLVLAVDVPVTLVAGLLSLA